VSCVVRADGPGTDDPDTPPEPYDPEDPPPAGSLVIKDGKFKGLKESDSTRADIGFITAGYTGDAEVYYAVADAGASAPGYAAYTGALASAAATDIPEAPNPIVPHVREIALPGEDDEGYQADGNYDVYVMLYKEGKVSAPVKINTKQGGGGVDWIWGEEVPEGMAAVTGGTFLMGSPPGELHHNEDETQHPVTVGNFYIGKYEVSQEEYGLYDPEHNSYCTGAKLPVEMVSWYDAAGYCNWLSEREGLSLAYTITKWDEEDQDTWTVSWNQSANGYRLPTEAEWEYACRAGTTTAYNTGGSITKSQANYDDGTGTVEVDSFDANGFGIYNMHGNVYEWCWDWYGTYPTDGTTNPAGPDTGAYRVIRGGSWNINAQYLRSAYRDYDTPSYQVNFIGFRLARGAVGG
jgi:formylglycine-generating enzyme required for sulfatase activity